MLTAVGCNEVNIWGGGGADNSTRLWLDTFTQVELPRADILLVIDNTGTMADEGCLLSVTYQDWVVELEDLAGQGDNAPTLSWQVAVLTTDMMTPPPAPEDGATVPGGTQGVFRGYTPIVSASTPNWPVSLLTNLGVGSGGEAANEGLESMRSALRSPLIDGANLGFLRPGSHLYVIFISDGDDDSRDYQDQQTGVDQYRAFLEDLRPEGQLHVASFVTTSWEEDGNTPSLTCGPAGGSLVGSRYMELVSSLGGSSYHLQSEIGELLGVVRTEDLRTRRFPLTRPPLEGPVVVWVEDQRQDSAGWILENQELVFVSDASLPPYGATIRVEYLVEVEP